LKDPSAPISPKSDKKNDSNAENFQNISEHGIAPSSRTVDNEKRSKRVNRIEEKTIAIPELNKMDGLNGLSIDKVQDDIKDVIHDDRNKLKSRKADLSKDSEDLNYIKTIKNKSFNSQEISYNGENISSNRTSSVLKKEVLTEEPLEDIKDHTEARFSFDKEAGGGDNDPKDFNAVSSSLVTLLKPRSYEAEQFKILRTNLLFPESGKPARSILITSAAPGDGKTFVSSNLAISLALDYDRKVLLIDADVRRSEIHNMFGLNQVEKGICDFLAERIPLSSLLVKTSFKNLLILPAGKATRNSGELQSLEKLPTLFEELAKHYGDYFIIIDSPPPKLASETGVLARLVDSVVIVLKAGVTKREYVVETLDLLGKGKIAGIVFNWHDNRMSHYRKYAKDREYYS
jgi:capsular exopolysaccharide synthesis family protein